MIRKVRNESESHTHRYLDKPEHSQSNKSSYFWLRSHFFFFFFFFFEISLCKRKAGTILNKGPFLEYEICCKKTVWLHIVTVTATIIRIVLFQTSTISHSVNPYGIIYRISSSRRILYHIIPDRIIHRFIYKAYNEVEIRTERKQPCGDTWPSLGCQTAPLEDWSKRNPPVDQLPYYSLPLLLHVGIRTDAHESLLNKRPESRHIILKGRWNFCFLQSVGQKQ